MKLKDSCDLVDKTMTWDDTFLFRCYPGVECFNVCCQDVTIFLTSLDVIRLRKALNMSSTDFLEKYTHILISRESGLPAVAIRMNAENEKKCPFVRPEGCSVYEARPYSCRLFPLDTEQGVEYKIVSGCDFCKGLMETEEWTVERWRKDQNLYDYDDPEHNLKDVMAADRIWEAKIQDPRMQDMYLMSLYDIDRFREFVFNSTFLEKFKIDDEVLEKIRNDDVLLLYFAAQWLRFVFFGQKGFLKIDKDYLEQKKKEVLGGKESEK